MTSAERVDLLAPIALKLRDELLELGYPLFLSDCEGVLETILADYDVAKTPATSGQADRRSESP